MAVSGTGLPVFKSVPTILKGEAHIRPSAGRLRMNRTRAVVFLIALLAVFFVGSLPFSAVEGSTSVYGIVSSDTTWTKADSPYNLIGPVGVASGATLTIEPGVVVNIGSYYIVVNGTLTAKGTNDQKILLNGGIKSDTTYAITFNPSSGDWNDTGKTGSIIENAILNDTSISTGGCKLNNDYIAGKIVAGYSTIANSTILQTQMGSGPLIEVFATSPTIVNNTLSAYVAIAVYSGGSPVIANNSIRSWADGLNGIVLNDGSGTAIVSGNVISDFPSSGMYVSAGVSSNVTVDRNLFVNNYYGLNLRGAATIRNNTIANNNIGILGTFASTNLTQNNLQSNTQFNLKLLDGSGNADLPNNWWGSTDQQTIAQTIYDGRRDFNLGTVNFIPFLVAPNPMAPQVANQGPYPTPSPSPTIAPTATPVPSYPITTTHVGLGSMSPSDGTSTHQKGTIITLSATASTGYSFMCWLQNGTLLSESNPYNYTVTNSYVITAVFYDPATKPTPQPSQTPTASSTSQPTAEPAISPTPMATSSSSPTLEPNGPTSSPDPTPAVPELSLWAIVSLFVAATLTALLYIEKKKNQ